MTFVFLSIANIRKRFGLLQTFCKKISRKINLAILHSLLGLLPGLELNMVIEFLGEHFLGYSLESSKLKKQPVTPVSVGLVYLPYSPHDERKEPLIPCPVLNEQVHAREFFAGQPAFAFAPYVPDGNLCLCDFLFKNTFPLTKLHYIRTSEHLVLGLFYKVVVALVHSDIILKNQRVFFLADLWISCYRDLLCFCIYRIAVAVLEVLTTLAGTFVRNLS